jgi:hypothetical protein
MKDRPQAKRGSRQAGEKAGWEEEEENHEETTSFFATLLLY